MNSENLKWISNTNVVYADLLCTCGKETNIYHASNWHDNTGVFYTHCPNCNKETNIRWKQQDNKNAETKPSSALSFLNI